MGRPIIGLGRGTGGWNLGGTSGGGGTCERQVEPPAQARAQHLPAARGERQLNVAGRQFLPDPPVAPMAENAYPAATSPAAHLSVEYPASQR